MLEDTLSQRAEKPQTARNSCPMALTPRRALNRSPTLLHVRGNARLGSAAAVAVLLLFLVLGWIGFAKLGLEPLALIQWVRERPVMDMVRYAERRLEGHPRLEAMTLPTLSALRARLEREPPPVLQDLGKGQRSAGVGSATFGSDGRPRAVSAVPEPRRVPVAAHQLSSAVQIAEALEQAQPGDVLEIQPGTYSISRTMTTRRAGTPAQPITLRARRPGEVTLLVDGTQAVVVSQPYWVFENLDWRGVCKHDDDCEHAYHVVGRAHSTVIVNNRIADFNAQIKVNGEQGRWPDHGLLQFTTLINTRPRNTTNPVAPFDLVAASGWQVLDNRIENFTKDDRRSPAYGVFMKGAGRDGRIERNLVICTPRGMSQPGLRIGLSLGNGGSDRRSCRDSLCESEHFDGLIANNVVAHCNDAGIDVSKAQGAVVVHNTLINTQGVLVRNPPANAMVDRNLLDDRVRARQDTYLEVGENLRASSLTQWLQDPDALDLRWREIPPTQPAHQAAPLDFCGKRRPTESPPGATVAARC